jgi:ATP-dependent DNA helicase RecQ
VRLRKEAPRPATSRSASRDRKAKSPAADLPEQLLPVFEALRAWRGAQAKENGVPAYVIFHDATLKEIALQHPTSVAQLGAIGGVGEKKLATWGEGVLGVLAGLDGAGSSGPAAPAGSAAAEAPEPDPGWPEDEQEPEDIDW